jgi:hypothetical protein
MRELSDQVDKKRGELETMRKEEAEVKATLDELGKIKEMGFDRETLQDIEEMSKAFGGPKKVITAIKEYKSLNEIISQKGREKIELETVKAEHVHLQPVVSMCDEFVYEFGFTPKSVSGIYDVAKKYGKPHEVFAAMGDFKDLNDIKSQAQETRKQNLALEARRNELGKEVETLTERRDELMKSVALAINSVEENCKKRIASISSTYEEHLKKWGELKAEAGKFEEELKLARIFNAIYKYPSETKDLPLEFVLRLNEAVRNICTIKGVNPEVQAGDEIHSRYPSIGQFYKLRLLDILEWAHRGLLGEILKPKS